MRTLTRVMALTFVLLTISSGTAAAEVFTGVPVQSQQQQGSTIDLSGRVNGCLTPPAYQSEQQTQAICVSLLQTLMAIIQQYSHRSVSASSEPSPAPAPVPQHVSNPEPAASVAPSTLVPLAVPSSDPRIEIASTTMESVTLRFFNMPYPTRIVIANPVTGATLPGGGYTLLGNYRNGFVTFPMRGEYAGNSFVFRAENASTSVLTVLSPVFAVPKPSVGDEVGTYMVYDGEVPLWTFPLTSKASAITRCAAEKTAHPTRNTRCTWNGASIGY